MKSFSSKILLLGEYGLLLGSGGFALPYPAFSGQFDQVTEGTPNNATLKHSNQQLQLLVGFLEANAKSFDFLNFKKFGHDVQHGLCFSSNIPQGYGVGSSGALTAALFDRYACYEAKDRPLTDIRTMLASIEQFFHGTSSGLDPLVSYVNAPLTIGTTGEITLHRTLPFLSLNFDENQAERPSKRPLLFLIDTLLPAATGNLVEQFLLRSRDPQYREQLEAVFLPVTTKAIDAFIDGNLLAFEGAMFTLSEFQHNHFGAMIPPKVLPHFANGIESRHYAIKLCGSGGGGFMLGCAIDSEATEKYFHDSQLPLIWL